jgi:hypothetical protein
MNRFSLAVTAAVVSATAVTGVMAFSALGDDQRPTAPTAADLAKKRQAVADPGVAPPELLACLRAHGLNPPTAPDELKMWILRTPAAKPCIETGGPKKPEGGGCGDGKPAVVVGDRRPSS